MYVSVGVCVCLFIGDRYITTCLVWLYHLTGVRLANYSWFLCVGATSGRSCLEYGVIESGEKETFSLKKPPTPGEGQCID